MSNKAVIERMFDEIVNQGKIDLVDELFDPDFTTETPQGTFDREGFKQYIAAWREGFSDICCEVSDLIEEGDRIAWAVRAKGTNDGSFMGIPATGQVVDFDSLNVATFKEGRGYRHRMVMDTMSVMTQLGLVPGQV